jgi:hypothetical protein
MLVAPRDFAQPPPHVIAHDRTADASRSDESSAERPPSNSGEYADHQYFAAIRAAFPPHPIELRLTRQTASFRKRKGAARHALLRRLSILARVQQKSSLAMAREDFAKSTCFAYGEGEVVTLMFVFDSVLVSLVSVAGDGFTIVVLLSFVSVFSPPAGGVTVVSFCSQAASKAALARMQMYFFIR